MSNFNQSPQAAFAHLFQGVPFQFHPHAHPHAHPQPALPFQNIPIHPALLNQSFGNQNHVFQQNPGVQNHAFQQNVVPQQNAVLQQQPVMPAVNTAVRPKAPTPKRLPKKPKSKPKSKQSFKDVPFPFMELPLEIRLMIYKLLLEETSTALTLLTQGSSEQEVVRRGCLKKQQNHGTGRQILLKTVHKPNDETITHLQPVILRVSKPIYEEAISILYRQTLEFEHPIALQKFLFAIGPNNRLLLQHIVLRGWQDDEFPVWQQAFASAFDRLLTAENLKSITMDRHIYSSSDRPKVWWFKPTLVSVNHFNVRTEYWAQCIDVAKGKGTARSLLTFTDRNFGSEDQVALGAQDFLDRKGLFMDNMKLG